jgi:hypothetical protein
MTVFDLTREEKRELKCQYLAEKEEKDLSYGELANIDLLVTDSEIEDVYCDTYFSPDDFYCNEGLREE